MINIHKCDPLTHHAKLRLFSEILMSGFIADSDRAESGGGGGGGEGGMMPQSYVNSKYWQSYDNVNMSNVKSMISRKTALKIWLVRRKDIQ